MDLSVADQPLLLTRDLRVRGVSSADLRRAVRSGHLLRVARGAYAPASVWRRSSLDERYRLRCVAHAHAGDGVVLSHQSAAAVLRMPLVAADLTLVHVIVPPAGGTRTSGGVKRHARPAPPHGTVEGASTTSPADTLLDLALTCSLVTAVAAVDHALARGLVAKDDVRTVAAERGLQRGRVRLERVLALADSRAESPGESMSRVRMAELGFPSPVLQKEWRLHDGSRAFSDFWWPEWNLIGEFDGVAKYVRQQLTAGSITAEVVLAEKRREDALRSLGPRVTRWDWATALEPRALHRHLTAAGLPSSLRLPL